MKKLTLYFFISIGLLIGCKKESAPATKTENPAKATIDAKLVVDSFYIYSIVLSSEFGNKFYSSKNGKITKLGCQMRSNGTYIVSLWDFSTSTLISATNVNVNDTINFFYNSISPVSITANTRYVVSVYVPANKKYTVYFKKPSVVGPSIYPFTSGSITFEDRRDIISVTSTSFPNDVNAQWTLLGVPDMQFEYTE